MTATVTDVVYGLQNLRKKINGVGEKESPLFHIAGSWVWELGKVSKGTFLEGGCLFTIT